MYNEMKAVDEIEVMKGGIMGRWYTNYSELWQTEFCVIRQ